VNLIVAGPYDAADIVVGLVSTDSISDEVVDPCRSAGMGSISSRWLVIGARMVLENESGDMQG
jgi:hypothetical protein